MKKKVHGVQLLLRCVVRDPDGKIITDTGEKPAKSFLIQFLEILYAIAAIAVTRNATAIDGTEDPMYYYTYPADDHFRIDGAVNSAIKGIVVGTGDTAETNTDYKLDTKLTEGATVGKITHGVVTVGTPAVVGANVDLEVKRSFTNNTGSAIIVKEAGIQAKYTGTGAAQPHLIVRDVLAASVEVPDKCSLTIYYTIRTTV